MPGTWRPEGHRPLPQKSQKDNLNPKKLMQEGEDASKKYETEWQKHCRGTKENQFDHRPHILDEFISSSFPYQ